VILSVDLGTSATKAVLWSRQGPVGFGRSEVLTRHPEPGRAEQDPGDWLPSITDAVVACRDLAGQRAWRDVEALVFSSARETFVPVRRDGSPIGPALVWSDRRANAEAAALASDDTFTRATGVLPDAGTTVAKLRWLDTHEPKRLRDAAWVLAPRDFVVLQLTGVASTDPTLASRTGCYDIDGVTPTAFADVLPPVLPSTDVVGDVSGTTADALALPHGVPVVIGAGDRACEVLGTGASMSVPMVSWGTTANVSVPVDASPERRPPGFALSRGALGGHVLEAGLSAAGAAVEWLSRLTGSTVLQLADQAATSPAGARGVIALPWLNGARAPWWQPGARATFANLTAAHDAGDLARAVWEAVADDVARCVERLDGAVEGVVAAGGGVAGPLWLEVLSAATGGPVTLRRSGEAASAGACRVAAVALGQDDNWPLDAINPVTARVRPDPDLAARARDRRPLVDRVAATMARLDLSEWNV